MFHPLNGCETVPSFAGYCKNTAWAIWTLLPELTDSMLKLSTAPSDIAEDVMHTIDILVILLYDKTSTFKGIDKTRNKHFAKKNNAHLIPPNKAALKEHAKGAAYKGGHGWEQTLLPAPELPPPTSWGWANNEEGCTSRIGQDYLRQPTPAMC